MKIEEAFGTCLKNIRKRKKMTQEQLAVESKLDRTFISMLERSQKKPTLNTIFQLCSALEIRPSELINMVEDLVYKDSNHPR